MPIILEIAEPLQRREGRGGGGEEVEVEKEREQRPISIVKHGVKQGKQNT